MVETKKVVDYIIIILIIGTTILLGFYFINKNSEVEKEVQEDYGIDFLADGVLDNTFETSNRSEFSSSQISRLINQIKAIEMDDTFFESDSFIRLIDNTVNVAPQSSGISNPFIRLF